MKKYVKGVIYCGVGCIAVAVCVWGFLFYGPAFLIQDTAISGLLIGSRTFSNTITVTGDTTIIGRLIVSPGTVVRFEERDDQQSGSEVLQDGYNDADPTRLKSYTTIHSHLFILGKVDARGTADAPIVFTSANDAPQLADWEAIYFWGDYSIFDHSVIEYSRNGMNPLGNQPHSVAQNSIFRHNFWSGPSLSSSSMQLYDNDISDAGHEGVDVQDGSPVIKRNTIHDVHAGIVVVAGKA